jgi:hypothetical protein
MHEAISQTITPAAPFCVDGPIERRCGEIIRILDMWAAGDRTNAGYELRLNGASMALASGRLLAGSLARDVLGGEG